MSALLNLIIQCFQKFYNAPQFPLNSFKTMYSKRPLAFTPSCGTKVLREKDVDFPSLLQNNELHELQ